MIPVTKPYLPAIDRYMSKIVQAYSREWLTNRGELVCGLELRLKQYLDIPYAPLIMNNGTVPLQIAIKMLPKGSEIITTPFSYIATTSSILWEGAVPVFVDIDNRNLTINPDLIESAITPKTSAILATHVFGNPCDIEAIEKIAAKNSLKVIYDAAHAFGVKYMGRSIFIYGDFSTSSFHATKLFHTGEGGAAFVNIPEWRELVYESHNFGHHGPFDYLRVGINGKMSELQAAMGHAVLDDMDFILERRKTLAKNYDSLIHFGKNLRRFIVREGTEWNYSYYPVIFEDPVILGLVRDKMNALEIFPRRYFYPSLNTIDLFSEKVSMPVSEWVSERILCLPLFHTLEEENQQVISRIINDFL